MNSYPKISQTILEFGKSVFLELPSECSKEDYGAALRIVIAVWNAITIDSWNGNDDGERELFKVFDSMPKEQIIVFKRLIKRKKNKFPKDLRAVGEHWIREENGEFIFGCEARGNSKTPIQSKTIH